MADRVILDPSPRPKLGPLVTTPSHATPSKPLSLRPAPAAPVSPRTSLHQPSPRLSFTVVPRWPSEGLGLCPEKLCPGHSWQEALPGSDSGSDSAHTSL